MRARAVCFAACLVPLIAAPALAQATPPPPVASPPTQLEATYTLANTLLSERSMFLGEIGKGTRTYAYAVSTSRALQPQAAVRGIRIVANTQDGSREAYIDQDELDRLVRALDEIVTSFAQWTAVAPVEDRELRYLTRGGVAVQASFGVTGPDATNRHTTRLLIAGPVEPTIVAAAALTADDVAAFRDMVRAAQGWLARQ